VVKKLEEITKFSCVFGIAGTTIVTPKTQSFQEKKKKKKLQIFDFQVLNILVKGLREDAQLNSWCTENDGRRLFPMIRSCGCE
jgi:hypothetical protein